MLDLSTISQETLLARGQYASVRGAHEGAKKELARLCGGLQSQASLILRCMQPDNDAVPVNVNDLVSIGRQLLDEIERLSGEIESLARQRAELKQIAWPKE